MQSKMAIANWAGCAVAAAVLAAALCGGVLVAGPVHCAYAAGTPAITYANETDFGITVDTGELDVGSAEAVDISFTQIASSEEDLTETGAFDALYASTVNTFHGVYVLQVKVDGTVVSGDFGTLGISFEVGTAYNKKSLTVHWRDSAGYYYSKNVRVADGLLTISTDEAESMYSLDIDESLASSGSDEKTSLAGASVSLTKASYSYTGTARKPGVTVTLDGAKLASSCYTVTYSNNTAIGTATVTVAGRSSAGYTGMASATFAIKPAAAKVKSAKSKAKRKLTVKLSGKKGGAKYQLRYRAKGTKKWKTLKATAKAKRTIGKLKRGKKYQVQVRAYKKVSGKVYTSAWSKTKTAKVK